MAGTSLACALRGLLPGILLAAALGLPASAAPQRVVSINLCADNLLLALADPGQIASLSSFAADPQLSFLAEKAAAFPHEAGSAESVIPFRPDLVLAGRFTRSATRDILGRLGYRLVALDFIRDIEGAKRQITEVASLLGHPERGAALVAEIEAAEAEARRAITGTRPTAAVYQRRGYVTGGDTLTGALMEAAGLANAGGALAGESGGFVPLERIVAARPDFLIVAGATRAEDQGSALLDHPALVAFYPPERRIALPERLTVCAGPALPAALRHLAAEAERLAR